jgi:hypothetical protein
MWKDWIGKVKAREEPKRVIKKMIRKNIAEKEGNRINSRVCPQHLQNPDRSVVVHSCLQEQ